MLAGGLVRFVLQCFIATFFGGLPYWKGFSNDVRFYSLRILFTSMGHLSQYCKSLCFRRYFYAFIWLKEIRQSLLLRITISTEIIYH